METPIISFTASLSESQGKGLSSFNGSRVLIPWDEDGIFTHEWLNFMVNGAFGYV